MNQQTTERYSRQLLLSEIGKEGQAKLQASKVLVIGAGGLGCPILQYLTGAGVGTIGIIDDDVVSRSNLHRQILYGERAIGQNKATAAAARLKDLNPEITINTYAERLTTQNALPLFAEYDIIVDGSDNFSTRYLVNDACVLTNKSLIYGAIYKFEGQVSVFNYNNGPTYRCLFPEPPAPGSAPSCSEIGVLGVLPGMIGCFQANETLKLILGIGETLSGTLLLVDALSVRTTTLKIARNQELVDQVLANRDGFAGFNYEVFCGLNPSIQTITFDEAFQLKNAVFIDVREPHEQPKVHQLHPQEIPLGQLADQASNLDRDNPIICFCQSGMRSKTAAETLMNLGLKEVYSLKQGAPLLEQVL